MEPKPPVVKRENPRLARLAAPKILLGILAGCAVLVAVPVIAYAAFIANQPAQPAMSQTPTQPTSQPSAAAGQVPVQVGGQAVKALEGSLTAVNGDRLTIQLRSATATVVLGSGVSIFDVTAAGSLAKGNPAQLQPGELVMARGAVGQPDGTYQVKAILFGSADAFRAYHALHARPGPAPTPTARA